MPPLPIPIGKKRRRPRPWPWPPPPPLPWYVDSRGVRWTPTEILFAVLCRSDRGESLGAGTSGLDDAEVKTEAAVVIERWAAQHP
jgi:hypothetical protein